MAVSTEGIKTVAATRAPVVRFGAQFALDAIMWVTAIVLAEALRYEFEFSNINWISTAILCLAAVALQGTMGMAFALYKGRYTYGNFDEVRALGLAVIGIGLGLAVVVAFWGKQIQIPRGTALIALPIALLGMFALRYLKRLYVERRTQPNDAARRTLIYGAGYLGSGLVKRMLTDKASSYFPVGLIDDNPSLKNLRHSGVPVRGTGNMLAEIARETEATELVVCIGRADSALMRKIADHAAKAGLNVKVMPRLDEMVAGKTGLADLRDVSIEDLIGRHPVDTDVSSIAGYLTGKRVLVTGAGGSIGAELCIQISKYGPGELIMLDRDETGLQGAQIGVLGHGLLHTKDVVLADIRDVDALNEIFNRRRPEVVFHAAALKHLPMLEQYPDEAWKTNVLGTLNVLCAAQEAGVTTFVNISTDKAADPTSVLGHSKRVAEKLTAWMADETGNRYLSVRFGNVIGSRGSMLPTFTRLIQAGGPLTVTHPDVTRYFMTIPEACQLVVQAGGIGEPGEVLILDMGEPVKILDVAERMIAMSGRNIEIVFTGLRDGEKMHEILIGQKESDERPRHPKISHARVNTISPERLDKKGWEDRMFSHPRNNDTNIIERLPQSNSPQKEPSL